MMQASSGTPLRRLGDEARDIATCVYTGLMTDTGNFSYNSNRAQIYPMIAQLIEAGVDKDAIYNAVFNQYSVDRMKMVGYCLYQKMRVFPENHAALIYLNRKELYRFNFQKGDAEGIVNMPMQSLFLMLQKKQKNMQISHLERLSDKKTTCGGPSCALTLKEREAREREFTSPRSFFVIIARSSRRLETA